MQVAGAYADEKVEDCDKCNKFTIMPNAGSVKMAFEKETKGIF